MKNPYATMVVSTVITLGFINSQGQILVNGGFESPVLVDGGPFVFHTGDPGSLGAECGTDALTLPGWEVGTNMVVVLNRGPAYGASAADGQQFLAFDPGNRPPGGNISQTFQTTPGLAYAVTFAVGDTSSGTGLLLDVSLFAVGGSPGPLAEGTFAPPSSAGFGQPQSLLFTAQSSSSTLAFTDISNPQNTVNQDLLLDAVSVVPVPEPGPCEILACLGALGIAVRPWLRRPRRATHPDHRQFNNQLAPNTDQSHNFVA